MKNLYILIVRKRKEKVKETETFALL